MNGKHFVGRRVSSFERFNPESPVTGVRLLLDEENGFEAGDMDGNVWEMENPYATQAMADNVLASLAGKTYTGFDAESAPLRPDAELGDGVTVNGLYSVLAYQNVTFGPGHMSAISAPGDDEPEEEYRYVPAKERMEARKLAQTRAIITRTAEEISLRIEEVGRSATEELEKYAEGVTKSLGELQSQIDGAIMTWFYDYEPTTVNEPASLWTTDAEKSKHLGDVFYIVDNDEKGGQAYRWEYVDGAYRWSLIKDVEVTKALADAARAQDTADKKRRVFTAQPTPPYDVGDLWAGGPSGDLMRCKTARTSGAYNDGDWEKASKYTDNSYAQQRYSELEQKIGSIKLSVVNGNGSSTLTLTAGDTKLSSAEIVFTGFVTFNDLKTSGKTTISGGNVTTDIIQDQKKKNKWNLNTGELVTDGMTANNIKANGTFQCGKEYILFLTDGQMSGWRDDGSGLKRFGYIDFTAKATSKLTGEDAHGMLMHADGVVLMYTPQFATAASSDLDTPAKVGVNASIYETLTARFNNTTYVIGTLSLEFVNGICTVCSFS